MPLLSFIALSAVTVILAFKVRALENDLHGVRSVLGNMLLGNILGAKETEDGDIEIITGTEGDE